MRKAVILFNLGGPDKLENVEPFLFNLFNDPAILNLPTFIRYPLAKLISNRRAPTAKKIYKELGGSSPILKLTNEQSEALEKKLNENDTNDSYKCFVVMRCWNPRAEKVINDVIHYGPEEIILLPLYPQYSAATSGSSLKEWNDICKKNNFLIKTSTICCYPTDLLFIKSHVNEIIKKVQNLSNFSPVLNPAFALEIAVNNITVTSNNFWIPDIFFNGPYQTDCVQQFLLAKYTPKDALLHPHTALLPIDHYQDVP